MIIKRFRNSFRYLREELPHPLDVYFNKMLPAGLLASLVGLIVFIDNHFFGGDLYQSYNFNPKKDGVIGIIIVLIIPLSSCYYFYRYLQHKNGDDTKKSDLSVFIHDILAWLSPPVIFIGCFAIGSFFYYALPIFIIGSFLGHIIEWNVVLNLILIFVLHIFTFYMGASIEKRKLFEKLTNS